MTINAFYPDRQTTVCNMQILNTHLKIEQTSDAHFYHNNSFALKDQLELD